MKNSVLAITLATVLALSLGLVFAGPVGANGSRACASAVSESEQGLRQNYTPITDPARTDPLKALGAPDGVFFSLGFGGSIVLEFPEPVGESLTVWETTWGYYPPETATVDGSTDGVSWTFIGTANNATGQPGTEPHPTTFTLDRCINYVRITDTSDRADFNSRPTADAFDLDAVCGEPCPNEPPDCSGAYADLGCLWPPNHKFVDINIMGVTDPDGDPVTITITGITSDEPTASDKGSGGAKHAPDAYVVDTDKASVRAERSGRGDGRVYVINFTASDGMGGECTGSVMVKVPHDQSDKTCPAIDSGQDYDATAIN